MEGNLGWLYSTKSRYQFLMLLEVPSSSSTIHFSDMFWNWNWKGKALFRRKELVCRVILYVHASLWQSGVRWGTKNRGAYSDFVPVCPSCLVWVAVGYSDSLFFRLWTPFPCVLSDLFRVADDGAVETNSVTVYVLWGALMVWFFRGVSHL